MAFFIKAPKGFQDYGKMCGVFPAWFKDMNIGCPDVVGTNVLFDWCILHVVPHLLTVYSWVGIEGIPMQIIRPIKEHEFERVE